ncbi:MAG: MFS transporter [Nanoarchaeota archaeon]|nr:MFS transporter [Nanoarchaeota archaeon]
MDLSNHADRYIEGLTIQDDEKLVLRRRLRQLAGKGKYAKLDKDSAKFLLKSNLEKDKIIAHRGKQLSSEAHHTIMNDLGLAVSAAFKKKLGSIKVPEGKSVDTKTKPVKKTDGKKSSEEDTDEEEVKVVKKASKAKKSTDEEEAKAAEDETESEGEADESSEDADDSEIDANESSEEADESSEKADSSEVSKNSAQEDLAREQLKKLKDEEDKDKNEKKKEKGGAGIGFLIIAAMLIWAWDFFAKYIGVTEVGVVFRDILSLGSWTLFGAILAVHMWSKRDKGVDLWEWGTFGALIFLIMFIALTGSMGYSGFIHFIYIIVFWALVVRGRKEGTSANIILIFLLGFDFYRFPLLQWIGLPLLVVSLIMAFPFLLLWTILYLWDEFPDNKIVTWAFWIFFVVMMLLNWENVHAASQAVIGEEEGVGVKNPWDVIKESTGGLVGFFGDMRTAYKKQLEFATGGYYQSKVERNEDPDSKLGVYLENVQVADKHFYENEGVVLWGDLKARTLEEPINVHMSCETGEGKYIEQGVIKPDKLGSRVEKYGIDKFEEIGFECRFWAGQLGPGTNSVRIRAEFNFETLAFIRTYFMDIERIRALRKENVNPLKQYGIKDTGKKGVSTYGPVKLGMGTSDPPVGLSVENDGYTYLGITLENQWPQGRIKNVTGISIEIPVNLDLEETSMPGKELYCREGFEFIEVKDDYEVYNMTETEIANTKTPITGFKSWRCSISVPKDKTPFILGDTPVATHHYRASANYIYELQKSKNVFVKSIPGEKTRLLNCTTLCKDTDGCLCTIKCNVPDGTEIEKKYTCDNAREAANKLWTFENRTDQIKKAEQLILVLVEISDLCIDEDEAKLNDTIKELKLKKQEEAEFINLIKTCNTSKASFLGYSQNMILKNVDNGLIHFRAIKARGSLDQEEKIKVNESKADFRKALESALLNFVKTYRDKEITVVKRKENDMKIGNAIKEINNYKIN